MAYNSAYTGAQVDAAVGAVRNKETTWDGKQNKLSGTNDQLVGFNSAGDAIPVAKPTAAEVGAIPDPGGGTAGQILTRTSSGVAWEDAPEGGVTSFNGRTGAVTPQSGDYTAEMVGARPSTWTPSAADVGAVPTTRTVNGHALSANVTLDADDVGARASTWTPTASDVGAVPTSRTVNGKALSSNISLTADDVGAANPPTLRTVTLPASGWSSNTQTVTVQGVKTSGQSVRISPATKTDADNWVAAGVWCSEPTTANRLVFTCDTAPTENININVELQEVQS